MSSRGHSKKGRKAIIEKLEKDGWYMLKGKRSDHQQFKHPFKPGKVTVPYYLTKNTELSIARQAGWRRNINREQMMENKRIKEELNGI